MPLPCRQTYAKRAAAIALVNTLNNADCRRQPSTAARFAYVDGERRSLDRRRTRASHDRRRARASIRARIPASGVAHAAAMMKVVFEPKMSTIIDERHSSNLGSLVANSMIIG